MVALSKSVKAEFARLMEGASDAELNQHPKVVAFKDSIQSSLPEGKLAVEQQWNTVDQCLTSGIGP